MIWYGIMLVNKLLNITQEDKCMDNTARKIVPFNPNPIDLEQFEADIRADERMRIKEEMRKRRLHRERIRRRKKEILLKYAIQKAIGLVFIVGSFLIANSGWMYDPSTGINDGTFMLITVPIGLGLLFTKEICID